MYVVVGIFIAIPGLTGLFSTKALIDGDDLIPQNVFVLILAFISGFAGWMYVAAAVANSYNLEATGADVLGAWFFGALAGFIVPWLGFGAGLLIGLILIGFWKLICFPFRKMTGRTPKSQNV